MLLLLRIKKLNGLIQSSFLYLCSESLQAGVVDYQAEICQAEQHDSLQEGIGGGDQAAPEDQQVSGWMPGVYGWIHLRDNG